MLQTTIIFYFLRQNEKVFPPALSEVFLMQPKVYLPFAVSLLSFPLFLEVSIGCEYATKNFDLPIVAGVIGWSGFCVHCQVFHSVIKCNMKKILFFLCRALHGALSAVFCALLVKAFPCPVSVFANSSENVQQLFKSNAPATAGLLLMCAILIFDFEESRNNKSQTFKSLKKVKILRK